MPTKGRIELLAPNTRVANFLRKILSKATIISSPLQKCAYHFWLQDGRKFCLVRRCLDTYKCQRYRIFVIRNANIQNMKVVENTAIFLHNRTDVKSGLDFISNWIIWKPCFSASSGDQKFGLWFEYKWRQPQFFFGIFFCLYPFLQNQSVAFVYFKIGKA